MATFVNQSKNTASWANQSKNTASWANDAKSTTHAHMLLENGNFFITESGGHILLESSGADPTSWANMIKN